MVAAATEPVDPNVDLWIDTSTDGSGITALDDRYVNADGDWMSGYLGVDRNLASGALPGLWVRNSADGGSAEVWTDRSGAGTSGLRIHADGKTRWLIADDGTRLVIARYNQTTGAWVETAGMFDGTDGHFFAAAGLKYKTINISGTNLNDLRVSGFYDGQNMTNAPGTGWYYVEHQEHSLNQSIWRSQRLYDFNGTFMYFRTMSNGTWTSWRFIGKSESTVVPATNWTHYGGAYGNVTCAHASGMVTVSGLFKTTTTVSFTQNGAVVMGTLPSSSWYPARTALTAGMQSSSLGGNIAARVDVNTAGQITFTPHANGSFAAGQWVSVNASYPVNA